MKAATLIELQQAMIDKVNACHRPRDRANRVRRAAHRTLRRTLMARGYTEAQAQAAAVDAWDVAQLERNAE